MKVLIVEDDKVLAKTIEQCLKNYDVDHAYDGEEGVLFAKQDIYDAIILDIMMPIMDGYEFLKEIRSHRILTPVLILTAKDGLEDKLQGFRDGADDFLVKPFNREELVVRVEALIRRKIGNYSDDDYVVYKDLRLDLKRRTAFVGDKELVLQGKQFDVLQYLIASRDSIVTKEQIFNKIWGFDCETTTSVIEVYASGLRKELKNVGYDIYLRTVRGVGYIWTE